MTPCWSICALHHHTIVRKYCVGIACLWTSRYHQLVNELIGLWHQPSLHANLIVSGQRNSREVKQAYEEPKRPESKHIKVSVATCTAGLMPDFMHYYVWHPFRLPNLLSGWTCAWDAAIRCWGTNLCCGCANEERIEERATTSESFVRAATHQMSY